MVKGLCALCAPLLLGGCWFIFIPIPGSLIQGASDLITGARGEYCVTRDVKVGNWYRSNDGQWYMIKSVSGETSRCPTETPIRADITR